MRWPWSKRSTAFALFAVAVIVFASFYVLRPGWHVDTLADVTPIPSLNAELLVLDASEIVERGPGRVVALRFHSPVEMIPYHFRDAGLSDAATIDDWRRELDVPVVINAGQYDEHGDHLGWLKGRGQWLSRAFREQWKALLVSGPAEGALWTGIVDLERSKPDVVEKYDHVVQSMMLVDRVDGVRVRDTDRTACRTAIAQDTEGRVLLIVTEGAVTLARFARWLTSSGLDVVRAMNLDGGLESQFALETEEASLRLYGQYGSGTEVFDAGAGPLRRSLPAVIGVRVIARDER
ncbi:MAG: phosphodiester glycosidase family protein [Myxococcota bacterium]